jgi:hypothetical protein
MQLRWTQEAAHDLDHITDYLFEHAPDRAAELVRTIYDAPATLPPTVLLPLLLHNLVPGGNSPF